MFEKFDVSFSSIYCIDGREREALAGGRTETAARTLNDASREFDVRQPLDPAGLPRVLRSRAAYSRGHRS